MKLYQSKSAPSPRRVRIFLAEKGVEIPTVEVDLAGGEQHESQFSAINPQREVPALELDDGTVICEVVAICRYLEEIYPEPPLIGRTATERAIVTMRDHQIQIHGFQAVAEALRNSNPAFKNRAIPGPVEYAQIPELGERGMRRSAQFMEWLDTHLGTSEFIAGDTYSMADITALSVVDFARVIKMRISDAQANLKRWHDAVSSRPSAQA